MEHYAKNILFRMKYSLYLAVFLGIIFFLYKLIKGFL